MVKSPALLLCGGALTVLIDTAPDTEAIQKAAARFAARQSVTLTFHGQDDAQAEIPQTFACVLRHRLVLAGRGAIFRSMA